MATEISIASRGSLPENFILSVRADAIRKQAVVKSGRPFKFPKTSLVGKTVKVEILQPMGDAHLVPVPGQEQYMVKFRNSDHFCELNLSGQASLAPTSPSKAEMDEVLKHDLDKEYLVSAAKDAKEYLEGHRVPNVVQALLKALITDKPKDPFVYMSEHLAGGYSEIMERLKTATPEPPALAVKEPKPDVAESAPELPPPAVEEPRLEEPPAEAAKAVPETADASDEAKPEKLQAQVAEVAQALADAAESGPEPPQPAVGEPRLEELPVEEAKAAPETVVAAEEPKAEEVHAQVAEVAQALDLHAQVAEVAQSLADAAKLAPQAPPPAVEEPRPEEPPAEVAKAAPETAVAADATEETSATHPRGASLHDPAAMAKLEALRSRAAVALRKSSLDGSLEAALKKKMAERQASGA